MSFKTTFNPTQKTDSSHQSQREDILFTINLKFAKKMTQLSVYPSDDDKSIIKRLCRSENVDSEDNYKDIHDKVIDYLRQLARDDQKNTGDMTQRLRQNIQNFLIRNGLFERKLTETSILTQSCDEPDRQKGVKCQKQRVFSKNRFQQPKRQKQNKPIKLKQSQTRADRQQLMNAYEAVYKKCRDPTFKAMAQSFLRQAGNWKKDLPQQKLLNKEACKIRPKLIAQAPKNINLKPTKKTALTEIDVQSNESCEEQNPPLQKSTAISANQTPKDHETSSILKSQKDPLDSQIQILKELQSSDSVCQRKDTLDLIYTYEESASKFHYNYSADPNQKFLLKEHLYESGVENGADGRAKQRRFNYFQHQF